MSGSIGDLFFSLHGDDSQLKIDAAKAGDAAGDSFGQTFGSKLKQAAGGLIGAGIGAAVGVMVSGANELDAATHQLMTDTGMTAAQAKVAEHAMAGMYRNNLQGFDQIGAAMAVVRNELGLTGKVADAMTGKFLKFSTATGQEAATATSSFADILHAFNLDASKTPDIMDRLIVSHQKYGTVITEDQDALVAMAPALDAMNMGVDDGIALLDLFQSAGINAAKAPMALAKAMKELKPGENLNDLIAKISAIEDPTVRAQEAIRIFGIRGGIQLAQAFKPGIVSLDQFKTSAADASGATDTAAASIESGFGNKFKLLMKKASGTLAEFGTSFNDLIGIAGIFSPAMTKALGAAAGGLAGFFGPKLLALILPQAVATGAAAGTASGTAFGAAMAVAIPLALFVGAAGLGALLAQALLGGSKIKPEDLLDPAPIGRGYRHKVVADAKAVGDEAGAALADGMLSEGTRNLGDQSGAIPKAVAAGIMGNAPKIAAAMYSALVPITAEMKAARQKAYDEAHAIPGDIAKALISGQADVESGMKALTDLMDNSLSDAAKIAYLKGVLGSKELARGLLDERADVRASAMQIRDEALTQLNLLKTGTADAAVDAGVTFAEQLRLQSAAAGTAAADVRSAAMHELKFADTAATWGYDIGSAWSGNLVKGLAANIYRAQQKLYDYKLFLMGRSPPEKGPLKDIDKGAFNIGKAWSIDFAKGIGLAQGMLNLPRIGMAPMAMAYTGAGSSAAASPAPGGFAPTGGGVTQSWHLTVNGVPYAFGTRDDFIKALDDLSAFGDGRVG